MAASTRPLSERRRNTALDTHLSEAAVEDARFMLDNGEHIDRVAKRLGMSVDAVEKMLHRSAA